MSLKIYPREFQRQAARLADIRTWPDAHSFWARQAKGVMKEVIANVPPAAGKADLTAKRIGERAVERDIGKLFVAASGQRRPAAPVAMESIHQSARTDKGRVGGRSRGRNRHRVTQTALKAYLRDAKKDVGKLAAGFVPGANAVGYRPPAWIARHSAPGSVSLSITSHSIRFRAINSVSYANKVNFLQSRIQRGVNRQTAKIFLEVEHLLWKAAGASRFHATRR
jgi:hypothetical protein